MGKWGNNEDPSLETEENWDRNLSSGGAESDLWCYQSGSAGVHWSLDVSLTINGGNDPSVIREHGGYNQIGFIIMASLLITWRPSLAHQG